MDKAELKQIKALFLDMDGVMWSGKEEIGNLEQIFNDINALGLIPVFGTNNATRTPEEYCERLAGYGVHVKPEQFFTSGIATIKRLRDDFPNGPKIHVFGSDSLKKLLRENGFDLVDEEQADVVLCSLDKEMTYEKVAKAMTQVMNGAKFYATNADATLATENGWRPGGGVIVNTVETCTGVKPFIIVKPNTIMIDIACKQYGLKPNEIMAVGDRHETDIMGGYNYGAKTALVMTGYETPATVPSLNPQPDVICKDLTEVVSLFKY